MQNKPNVKIIGCGITGVVIGRILAEQNFKVEILEKREHIGGNLYDYEHNGILVHKYGPHIFHTSKKHVIDFVDRFWKLNQFKNVVEGYVDGKLVPIPFNFRSIDLCFPKQKEEIKEELLISYPNQRSIPILELKNNKNHLIKKLANFVYENLFLNYTTKMWNLRPDQIDPSVTARIPIILSYENTYFTDEYEGLPIGGYTKAISKMLDHPNIKYQLNIDANSLLKFGHDQIYLNDPNEIIIYTGPLDKLFKNQFGVLDYRSLFFKFETHNQDRYQATAVVNYPAHPEMTRITEYKNMTLQQSDKTVISKEFPGTYNESDKKWNEPYYPLATQEARNKYFQYVELASQFKNLYLCGRLATYKYINMDEAIEQALTMADEILKKYN